jgi:hypothetical protein
MDHLAAPPEVKETRERYNPIAGREFVQGILAADPQGTVQPDMSTQMVVRIDIPFDAHGSPGHNGDARSLIGSQVGGDDGPEAQSGIRTEIPGSEVLLSDNGKR